MKKNVIFIFTLIIGNSAFGLSIMQEPKPKPFGIEQYQDSATTIRRHQYLKQLNRDIDQLSKAIDSALQQKAINQNSLITKELNRFIENQRKMRDVLIEHRTNIEQKNYTINKV